MERPVIQYLFKVQGWMSQQLLSGAESLRKRDEIVFTLRWNHKEVGYNTRRGMLSSGMDELASDNKGKQAKIRLLPFPGPPLKVSTQV